MINMNNISLTQTPADFKPADETLVKIARLYAEVFAEDPWFEYKECPEGKYFPRGFEGVCDVCSQPLELAYPLDRTIEKVAKEVGIAGSKLILFRDANKDVYAAGWGFPVEISAFRPKYKTPEMQEIAERALRSNLQGESFFYLSEIMVDSRVRKRGIATQITVELLGRANELGLDVVMRTSKNAWMVNIAKNYFMVPVVMEDSENKDRVLFLKKFNVGDL